MSGSSVTINPPADARGYKKLVAFQYAHKLARSIYSGTLAFPKHELFGLTSQMRRAAVSVAANIVEGYSRGTTPLFLRHLDISFGSCKEVEYYLELSTELGYISSEDSTILLETCARTAYMLKALQQGLKTKAEKQTAKARYGAPSTLATPSAHSTPHNEEGAHD